MEQKRNQFLTFVYLSALAHDLGHVSKDASFIASYAAQIPAEQIPPDPITAAIDLVKSFEGHRQKRWMLLPSQEMVVVPAKEPTRSKVTKKAR